MNNDNINFSSNTTTESIKNDLDNTKNKVNKERNEKKSLKIVLVSLIVVIVLVVAGFIIYGIYNKKTIYTFDKYKIYQYFSGIKQNYNGKLTIDSTGQIIKIDSEDKKINNISDTPIYFQEIDNEVFFAKNMGLVIPRQKTKNYRINYFTKVVNNTPNSYIENNKKKIGLETFFIYDGSDLYLFPDETLIIIEDKEYTLSPLSYITVSYQGQIEIYDKKNDKYTTIDTHKKDVIAKYSDYNINLSTDMILYNDGDHKLLVKNIDNLPVYENSK